MGVGGAVVVEGEAVGLVPRCGPGFVCVADGVGEPDAEGEGAGSVLAAGGVVADGAGGALGAVSTGGGRVVVVGCASSR